MLTYVSFSKNRDPESTIFAWKVQIQSVFSNGLPMPNELLCFLVHCRANSYTWMRMSPDAVSSSSSYVQWFWHSFPFSDLNIFPSVVDSFCPLFEYSSVPFFLFSHINFFFLFTFLTLACLPCLGSSICHFFTSSSHIVQHFEGNTHSQLLPVPLQEECMLWA